MMSALWPSVTERGGSTSRTRRRTTRCACSPTEIGFTVTPASGRISKPARSPELLAERVRLRRAGRELDPLIEILRVLPDHHEVDVAVPRRDTGEASRRTDGREQVQSLTDATLMLRNPEPTGVVIGL